jgi:hypothetical protein
MPIVEINSLTKDYEVGFFRKRKVRISWRERGWKDHDAQTSHATDLSE